MSKLKSDKQHKGDYALNQDDFYGNLYVVKNTHVEEDEDNEVGENITNDMIIRDIVEDDVTSIVNNVVQINANVEVEEYSEQCRV